MTHKIRHGASRSDPHETRVSRVNQNAAGRVRSGQEVFEISRVGSARVNQVFQSRGSGRVGSGRLNSVSKLAGRVGSRSFHNLPGQVGSGRDTSKFSQVGSGLLTRPDPTRPVRFGLTRKKPWKISQICIYI